MKLTTQRLFADLKTEAENLSRSGDIMLATSNRQILVLCEIIQEIIDLAGLKIIDDRTPEAIQAEEKIAAEAAARPAPQQQPGAMPTQQQLSDMIANAVAQAVVQLTRPAAVPPARAVPPAPAPVIFPPGLNG